MCFRLTLCSLQTIKSVTGKRKKRTAGQETGGGGGKDKVEDKGRRERAKV
jgi:hypothetical protein